MSEDRAAPGAPCGDVSTVDSAGQQGIGAAVHPRSFPRRRHTVLLAEDSEVILETVGECLEAAGHRVVMARNGLEAVEALTSHVADIGLAILDLDMPRMGGLDALERMRQVRPNLPALLSTGHSHATLDDLGPLPEGVVVIVKPYKLVELLRRVRAALQDLQSVE